MEMTDEPLWEHDPRPGWRGVDSAGAVHAGAPVSGRPGRAGGTTPRHRPGGVPRSRAPRGVGRRARPRTTQGPAVAVAAAACQERRGYGDAPMSGVGVGAAVVGHLTAGRAQMGTSLAFHLTFAVLGVGLPLLMLIAEGMHLRSGDPVWLALARRWAKAFGILFAVGAVSGTIISFELGLLFPRFMAFAGGIIGLPFSLEGFAFFIEAIFLGIYLYGWRRLSPRVHWLAGFPVAISAVASAFFIVTANAWMNVPRGFQLSHGRVTHVDPLAAMFNPAWATETSHMVIAAYLATAFGVASVYAVGLLRGRRDSYHRRALTVALATAAVMAPLQLGVGDLLGRTVARNQPAKLA